MWFGQGHREQDPVPVPGRAKSPEAPQQNAEEAHRARGAPRGARREETEKKDAQASLSESIDNRAVKHVSQYHQLTAGPER